MKRLSQLFGLNFYVVLKSNAGFMIAGIVLFLALLNGCANDYPDSIYNPNEQYKPDPVITSVVPDSALAGIDTLQIIGKNFSPVIEENRVFFNGTKAQVFSATPTLLTVKAPNVPGDSVKIRVNVKGALLFAEWFPYKMNEAAMEFFKFGKFDDAYAIACDLEENIYAALKGRKVIKITQSGERIDYADITVDKASGMKVGPNGDIFYLNVLQGIFRIPAGGGNDEVFAILPGFAYDLDFDQNENIYCGGGGNAIYRVKLDKSVKTVLDLPDISITALRVYNNYVYFGGTYDGSDVNQPATGVWRSEITSADGDLGTPEVVFDFAANFTGYEILSMTFSEDGTLYIGTDAPEAIVAVSPSGDFSALYPGVIEPVSFYMTWGNSNFLYVNRKDDDPENRKIIKLNMLKNGAPYFGRK